MEGIKPGDRVVKIKYDYDYMSVGERTALATTVFIGAFFILFAVLLGTSLSKSPAMAPELIVLTIVVFIVFTATLIIYFTQHNKRKREAVEFRAIKTKGEMVIGKILSMQEDELADTGQTFSYDIEYENPIDGQNASIVISPSALYNEMYIREKDLPLKVIVYCYDGKTHVDAVINPPITKMTYRKIIPFISGFISMVLFMIALVAGAANNNILFVTSLILAIITLVFACIKRAF
ncbi:hypothetical protein IJM16_01810 [Candidatus Saccharibacteria bacterium]|nr:hypothetical protein [Candidatus Saccharibacteria bacterium]